jgi:hypothetical protein
MAVIATDTAESSIAIAKFETRLAMLRDEFGLSSGQWWEMLETAKRVAGNDSSEAISIVHAARSLTFKGLGSAYGSDRTKAQQMLRRYWPATHLLVGVSEPDQRLLYAKALLIEAHSEISDGKPSVTSAFRMVRDALKVLRWLETEIQQIRQELAEISGSPLINPKLRAMVDDGIAAISRLDVDFANRQLGKARCYLSGLEDLRDSALRPPSTTARKRRSPNQLERAAENRRRAMGFGAGTKQVRN